ncbi:MAG: UDP-3-O-(3-hydroxymyristoyl)glucosamine N-acyltransferase [Gemmatimonadaceae bacterium]|nr:UDP-3-O-(3-hydroxymyristoyl)glucosamine N-acyltransferase [Gemmatimonadaceae bacterium]
MSSTLGNVTAGGEGVRTLTALAISELVRGELRGDASVTVCAVAPLDRAEKNQVSFLGNSRYSAIASATRAGVVLVTAELADSVTNVPVRIIVEKPNEAVLALLPFLYPESARAASIHATAMIGRGARLGKNVVVDEYAIVGEGAALGDDVWVGSHAVIGDGVTIGAASRIFPHVALYSGAEVGERVILHAGSRIGSDGFGYVQRNGAHEKIPHVGRCIIGNDVEIGANTTIDRGSVDDTVIGAGTKIDNLVHIGHNCRIGRMCLIMAQAGIAGSVRIEDGCIIAGQAGLGGHITIGKGARIAGQAGVFGDVPAGESWSGYPARPHKESLRTTGALFKLAGMLKRIEKLLDEKEKA